ncbi:NADH dehydrogenase [Trebonia kvetii]|uniref:NADH dehydrogenase n=1 Tax=Trebonia kvetii TaxID=2480626 RepID=A0A6P2BNU2_9ACTN|nr:complex I subunit 5 family protein [Trebonia kvetii]TVZ00739.1 NADH dehydrogenase [Trebonia kvetii]
MSIAVPLAGAALLAGFSRLLPRWARDSIAIAVALATTILTLILVAASAGRPMIYWFSGWRPAGGRAIGVDYAVGPLGAGMASLAGLLASAALVYCWRYFDTARGRHHALVLIFLAGSVDFCLTGDLFNLFVAFELVAVTAYALTGYNAGYPGPLQGAINFAVTNSLGGLTVLMGIGFLYARTGSLNLAQIGQALSGRHADGLVVVAFALLTGGFLIKAAVVPFHFWLPDAYGSAPIPVCVLFAGVMSELGLFAVIRVWVTVFSGLAGGSEARMRAVLLGFAILTAVVGAVMALAQLHLKRMLAFVTMSHLGIYLIGVGLLSPLGLAGASLLVIGDGLAKSALFLGVGVLQHERSSVSETRLRGRGRGLAVTGVTIAVGALVLADLPPFVSSTGHALLVDAADQAGLPWLEIVIAACVIASSGAVLRAAARIWLGWGDTESPDADIGTADDPGEEAEDRSDTADAEQEEEQDQGRRERSGQERRVPLTMVLPPLALLAIGLGLGLTAGIAEHAAAAASSFSDRAAYAAAVLGTHRGSATAGRTVVPASTAASAGGVLADLGQVLAALCVAAVALDRRASRLRQALAAGTRWLRRLHSGLVGDQVTWLVAGLALLAALGQWALH